MFKQTLRLLMVWLLTCSVLVATGGPAQAYLSPSNPDFVFGDPDAAHMPPSYEGDYNATLNDAYIIGPGSVPDYLTSPNWAYSPPLQKFVDPLPGLCDPRATNCDAGYPKTTTTAGKNIPLAIPDIVSYPGSDYYEIELVEFQEKMHNDLPPTTLRGYRQVGLATDTSGGCTDPSLNQPNPCSVADNTLDFTTSFAHYLGPVIVAQKDRPVRVKFINKLPAGAGGDLFVPVDTTIMGAGDYDVVYDSITKDIVPGSGPGSFSQNRGELHLHGGRTPWISDGTPHQWITPADETNPYNKGVSVENVPDMPDPGPGAQTYYWTNQQSARLMFYHDHAWGITRLNVYIGEAAGYLIRDDAEQNLIAAGVLPADEIPLVIQDKTFVDANTIKDTDPTWAWGTQPWDGVTNSNTAGFNVMTPVTGDLWWPHVYMPAQNPFDITGIAPMGRWAYGPYFWPATQNEFQPVLNPYYHPGCDPADPTTPGSFGGFCQPYEIPSTPNPSWGAEAFMDTPVVNGTAYPTMTVEPKPYRLRILNAAHDRFFNLSMFIAADNTTQTWDWGQKTTKLCDKTITDPTCTEVSMLPAIAHPGFPATWPIDGRAGGVPDYATRGPDWIMIGTEGGFLPRPVVIPPQPVNWNTDVTTFNAGNVNTGSLILGPAERADVIVDFSQHAGQTLILYNDAPAPWPALDPHYDYYTDPALDNTGMGGAGPTLPGVGPNTRTVMQIRVASSPVQSFNLAALQDAFNPATPADGVFRQSQDPIIAGQGNMNPTGDPAHYEAFAFDNTYPNVTDPAAGDYTQDFSAYNKLYGATFPTNYPYWGISRINDTSIRFFNPETASYVTAPLEPKAIQDEQGETFDMFGRMRAGLGLQITNRLPGQVGFVVQTYSDPSTEILEENGIQVWKITHNGVDTHPVHFHLFDVQVLNRVGWDGFIRLPDPTELGWKDTVRISPLEDTIVALKPITPRLPFGVPESVRPLNPATAIGSMTELTPIDPTTGQARDPATWSGNEIVNIDWEYVWHCHILSHEENDMMRPMSFQFLEMVPDPPSSLIATVTATQIDLNWLDPTPASDPATLGNHQNEISFVVERAPAADPAAFVKIATVLANATTYSDTEDPAGAYLYRVAAYNAVGSAYSNTASTGTPLLPPVAPTGLTADLQGGPQALLTWTDNADNETTFVVERSDNGGPFTTVAFVAPSVAPGASVSYVDATVMPGNSYTYQVAADNSAGMSAYTNIASVSVPALPAAPTGLTATLQAGPQVQLAWADNASNETGYLVERSVNGGAFALLASLGADAVSYTDSTVMAGNSYAYRVAAANLGGMSAYSNTATATVPLPPAAPTNLTSAVQAGPQIQLTWRDNAGNANSETRFVIERAINGGAFALLAEVGPRNNTGNVSYTDTTVTAGNSYTYRVAAGNAFVLSVYSNTTTAAIPVLPAAPTNVTAITFRQGGNARVTLNWTDNSNNEAGFRIQRATNPGFNLNLVTSTVGANATTFTTGNLPRNTNYYFRIQSYNGAGPSAWVDATPSPITTAP